ncbi:MAG: hypothetical protein J5826_02555 [Bacteroidales bacterium]|nr:hypothetical protein [Bacteroidales bacterium]
MENIGIGFLQGLGGAIGVIIGLMIVALIIKVIIDCIDKSITKKEMPGILLSYRKVLKRYERYEQLAVINKYKDELKKNQLPKELSKLYSIKVQRFVDVVPHEDKEGGRMWINSNRILIYHGPLKPNNENKIDTDNKDSEQQPKSDSENRPNNNQHDDDIS